MTFLVYRSSYAMNTDDDNKVVSSSVQRLFNFLFDAVRPFLFRFYRVPHIL